MALLAALVVLLMPTLALAEPVTLTHIELEQMSFTATGLRVEISYACPSRFHAIGVGGTYLAATQHQSDAVVVDSPPVEFGDQIVCDGQDHPVVARIHRVQDFNTTDRITFDTTFAVRNADHFVLSGEDIETVRPTIAPDPATTLADAELRQISFASTGALRVRFSYVCPSPFHPVDRSRIYVFQTRSIALRIVDLVVCDGTRHIAAARFANDNETFVATWPIHAHVGIRFSHRTRVTMWAGNGKNILVDSAA
jgi:hypothetical protein